MRNRRVHYWMSMAIALPLLLVIVTGIALQLKKQIAWVQPPEQRTEMREPTVAWEQILQTVRASDGRATRDATWNEVDRIDVRPSKGIAKVLMKDGWELQVDLASGRMLQRAIRRSDWIESLHDGSFFAGDFSKLGIFLPVAFALLGLWGTGLWMLWQPIAARRRQQARRAATQTS
jgi:uncharacterized iron-regulated membrane protein